MIILFICPLKAFYESRRITKAQIILMNIFRTLWEQHDVWTRAVITSIALDLPDTDLVTNRLLRNPSDFADTLRPYYGDKAASKFSDLLKSHLVIAAQLVKASKAGDSEAAEKAERDWYKNADEIAAFLSSINPYWSEESWRAMLHHHLELIKAEATDILTKNYSAGISVYDEIERQTLEMADIMSKGIIKQFPANFIQFQYF